MPRIPASTINTSVGPGDVVQDTGAGRAFAEGARFAQAAGDTAANFLLARERERNLIELNVVESEIKKSIAELSFAMQSEDPFKAPEIYEERAGQIIEDAAIGLDENNPLGAQRIRNSSGPNAIAARRISVISNSRSGMVSLSQQAISVATDNYRSAILSTQVPEERAKLFSDFNVAVNSMELLPVAEKAKRIELFRKDIEDIENAEAVRVDNERAARLEIAVNRAESDVDIRQRRAEVEAAFKGGLITDTKLVQLTKTLDTAAKQFVKSVDQRALVLSALSGGPPMDPANKDHKKAVDVTWEEVLAPQLESLEPGIRNEAIADFSSQVGMVPTQVVGMIRGQITAARSNAEVVEGADTLNVLLATNPQLVRQFRGDNFSFARMVTRLQLANVPSSKAVDIARNAIFNAGEPEQKVRAETYRQMDYALDSREDLEDAFDPFLPTGEPDIPDAMLGEYQLAKRLEFLRTGDVDAASSLAMDSSRGVWGFTDVGSSSGLVKYPVERYYPPLDGDHDYAQEQLVEDVVEGAVDIDGNKVTVKDGDRIAITPDLISARERQPTYVVSLRSDSGPVALYAFTVEGELEAMRWFPDFTKARNAKIEEDTAQARKAEAVSIFDRDEMDKTIARFAERFGGLSSPRIPEELIVGDL